MVNVCLIFQFHKGTIRTVSAGASDAGGLLFQFHKGTIRTVSAGASAAGGLLFQFHKGTIRTRVHLLLLKLQNISIP